MTDPTPTSVRIGSTYNNSPSNYVFQAVPLLDQCLDRLQRAIDQRTVMYSIVALVELKNSLTATDELLASYLYTLLGPDRKNPSSPSSASSLPLFPSHNKEDRTTISPLHPNQCNKVDSVISPPLSHDVGDGTNPSTTSARLLRILQQRIVDETNDYHEATRNTDHRATTSNNNIGGGRINNLHSPRYQYHQYQQHRNPQDPISPTRYQLSTSFYNNYGSTTTTKRCGVDTLLFRLIVTLQLLLVRIDDAHYVVTGARATPVDHDKGGKKETVGGDYQQQGQKVHKERGGTNDERHGGMTVQQYGVRIGCCLFAVVGAAGLVSSLGVQKKYGNELRTLLLGSRNNSNIGNNKYYRQQLVIATTKIGATWLGLTILNRTFKRYWMTDKINRSNAELLEWNHQWELIHRSSRTSTSSSSASRMGMNSPYNNRVTGSLNRTPAVSSQVTSFPSSLRNRPEPDGNSTEEFLDFDDKSRMLIEYAIKHSHQKSYFWRSQGEIRFLLLKRFMDVFYASVGTAINTKHTSALALPLVTGAAASFYTITGVSKQSLSVVNDSSRDLIQHAWGMVSLPAIKSLMLQASRLLKGAAVADRIVICGVPCFILSKDPAPELAAALQRQAKQQHRSGMMSGAATTPVALSQLSTIAESETDEISPSQHTDNEEEQTTTTSMVRRKSFAGSCGQYRQRDVILHLTGGGFFAHTIASDLPYLLDWSSSTGAVVICPEYALLPENQFPVALNQITNLYTALAGGDTTGPHLGFEVNRICVTGESAGGNLAAALCVKLAMHKIDSLGVAPSSTSSSSPTTTMTTSDTSTAGDPSNTRMQDGTGRSHRMPDAIMLSCPALNLTTELSHSRVVGTEDPVLPSGLLSAISEAYAPAGGGSSSISAKEQLQQHQQHSGMVDIKKDPLVSPFFASDAILQYFPPALLFASSNDPLLDDSVIFNERLRVVGVCSELIAVHNVPHAYLGLGTAGFPEAIQVQKYAIEFLSSKLRDE